MSETYTVSAKTVDEAMELASNLYGGKNKEISYDIISLPKKGFLGLGSKDAVIRVTVTEGEDVSLSSLVKEIKNYKNTPEEDGAEAAPKAEKTEKAEKAEKAQKNEPKPQKAKPVDKPKSEQQEKPRQPKAEKSPKQENKPAKADTPKNDTPKVEKTDKAAPQQKKQKKSPAEKPQKQEKAEATKNDEPKVKCAVSRDEMEFAISFVNKMAENMNLSATAIPVSAPEGEEYTVVEGKDVYPAINIEGDDTGILIGHHGETLDAIQYLVNLALFRRSSDKGGRENIKITVDIENYREKREETLRALARRMASRAVKYKRNVFLEPMNPYERRIIHSELQEYPDVATHSVGSDTNRKIIITYEGTDKAPANKKRSRGNNRRGNSQKQVSEPTLPQAMPLPTLDDIEE